MQGIFFKDFENSYIPEILKELYREKVYAPYLESQKNLTILDIGANIGLFSLYAYKYAKKIYALEPSATHLETLQTMVNYNHLDNVEVIPMALSSESGTAKFYHSQNVTMYSLNPLVNNLPDEEEEVVKISIDELFENLKIKEVDFMKLDTEGEEFNILCSKGFKKVCTKIKSLVVEWHSWTNQNPQQLVTTLEDLGYEVNQINADATLFYAKR